MSKRVKLYYFVVSVLFFLFSIGYVSVYYVDLLKILEESGIFLFSADFFREKITQPAGFIYYTGAFVRQFYYYPYLGVGVVALFLSAIQGLVALIFQLRGWKYALSFLPSVLLLVVQFEAAFQPELLIGFLTSLLLLLGYVKNRELKYIDAIALLVFLGAYFLISAYAIYALLLVALYNILHADGWRRFAFAGGALLLSVGIVFGAAYWIYQLYPVCLSFTGLKGSLFVSEGLYRNGFIVALFASVPFVALLSRLLKGRFEREGAKTILLTGALALGVYGAGAILLVTPRLSVLTDQIVSDRAATDEEWDRLLAFSQKRDVLSEYQIQDANLALCMKGELGDRLFSILQTSAEKGLYSVYDDFSGVFAQKFSYHLGLYNMAYRWAYECNAAYGNAPRFLKKMLQVAVINGEYAIARKYAATLSNTLFYRDFAKQYVDFMDDKADEQLVEYIAQKRKDIPKQNTLVSEMFDFGEVMRLYVESNPDNLRAYHYYLSYLLLKVDLSKLIEVLPLHYGEGATLPRHYEEAVVLYNMNTPQAPVTRYKIAESRTKSFFEFIRKAQNGASSVKSFETSFWFYVMFMATTN